MKAILLSILLILSLLTPSLSRAQSKAEDLEAKLRQTLDTSDESAKLLIELINLYYDEGQVFGLVRTGKTFVAAQASHPKHEEMMGKLIDGLAVASQNADLKSTILQFLERYPKSNKAADAHRTIAQIYDRENQRRQAADHYRQSWEKRGPTEIGIADASRAFTLYRDLRSQVTATIMGEMALTLMDQLPNGQSATEFAFQAFHQTRQYGAQYQLSNQVGRKLLEKKLPLTQKEQWQIHHYLGDNFRNLKQYTSAISAYQSAIDAGSDSTDSHRNLIHSLSDAQADTKQINQAVAAYQKAHPNETKSRIAEMLSLSASAKHRAGKHNDAIDQITQAMQLNGHHAHTFASWMRDKKHWDKAEAIYRETISKNPEELWRVHHSIAHSHYKDQKKDIATCIDILKKEVLYKSPLPNAGSSFGGNLKLVLEKTKSEADFKAEINRFISNAKQNAHDQNYVKALDSWLASYKNSKDSDIRSRYKFAEAEASKLRKSDIVKLWASSWENRMRGHNAREQLLKTKLSDQQKKKLLQTHAHDLRHHGKNRADAIPHYQQLAKLDPDNYRIARDWLDAAVNYGKADQCKAPLQAVLKLDQTHTDHSGWYLVSIAARKSGDPAQMKKALAWIDKQQANEREKNHYGKGIADQIRELKMPDEERVFLTKIASREPNHGDTIQAINTLAYRLPEGSERIKFLTPYLEPVSTGYSNYSSSIANEYLHLNDIDNFQQVCEKAQAVRKTIGFKRWSFSLHDWISRASNSKELTAAQKAIVFEQCIALGSARDRALGELANLEINGHELDAMERLLAYRQTTLTSQSDPNTHRYLMSWAQKAMSREEYAEAAAIGTGLLTNVKNVGVDYQQSARKLVREAYIKMGAMGLEVNANDPIAPLLEIGLHLKLGDQQRALDTYHKHQSLFDEYSLQLPVDIIAFAANSHITAGGEKNQQRAESILRKWLVKHSETEKYTNTEKAKIQLLLAKNYDRAKRFEVARSEYTTVTNRYPDTEQAIEARFGIGETQMSQKIFDQAEQTFAELATHPTAKVRIRGLFLQGVLEGRKGNQDEARAIFKQVLGAMPDTALANETLFNLSEVYRDEQRYLEQLELLRTVGRLGQDSKRWHEPGKALSVVVQDSDLGISRGHTRIPVQVTTEPGGDLEVVYISSGGAGRGLFIGEIETGLGTPEQNNGFLEVGGNDLIKVDYPDDFKSEFQFEPLSTGDIGLAIDADFSMASNEIVEVTEETESERLTRELNEQETDLRRSIQRPANQIKPGNPVYLQVKDLDRDLTNGIDQLTVKVTASSGDKVQATLKETGSNSGIFRGTVATSDLPAGALASDTAIELSPLMAIDKDSTTSWISQPDGVTPKFLSVDLKELQTVTKGTFTTPDPENQAPVRARLQGSHDGRYWYPLAEFPQRPSLELPDGEFKTMTRRVWHGNKNTYLPEWKQVKRLTNTTPTSSETVDHLTYSKQPPQIDDPNEKKRGRKPDPAAAMFRGSFIQPRSGAIRLGIKADQAAIIINGYTVLPLVPIERQHQIDIYLEAGIHDLFVFASTKDAVGRSIEITRARENPNNSQVKLTSFTKADFDLSQSFVTNLSQKTDYPLGTLSTSQGQWQFEIAPRELRHVRFVVDEYIGQSVAINSTTIAGPEKTYIPTETDLLQLSNNNQLEITPGDKIESVYIDQLPTGGEPKNRTLEQSLTATYYNGTIQSISYDFQRENNGQMTGREKQLLRIDPGERITLKVIDYDMDSTGQRDTLPINVQIGDGEIRQLTATETDNTTGIFKIELDTTPDQLPLKPGDQIYFTYRDQENTFPGHAIDRQTTVYVREPTTANMRIVQTDQSGPKRQTSPTSQTSPTAPTIPFNQPLTIEVIDPDAAKDSLSEVTVAISLADSTAPPVEVACVISSAHSTHPSDTSDNHSPLHQGRFIGQVTMKLGDDGSPRLVPREPGQRNSLTGRVLPPLTLDPETNQLTRTETEIEPGMLAVLNLTGSDTIIVNYTDNHLPNDAEPQTHTAKTTIHSSATLAATDVSYDQPIETLQVGERLFLSLTDPDQDTTPARDQVNVTITSTNGENETVQLEETLTHSGTFTGSFKLKAVPQPTPNNYTKQTPNLEVFFGETITITYKDPKPGLYEPIKSSRRSAIAAPATADKSSEATAKSAIALATAEITLQVANGTNGNITAFTKLFTNDQLAIQTQFHIAESYFELFKSHLKLDRKEEADKALVNGQRTLKELQEDHPDPKHAPRVAYLLGQFAQELKNWPEAIEAYEQIVKRYPDHTLAADAQYKLGQCYEQANRLDEALEAYVTLAATYPQNPLISNVMIRINEHFYKKEEYEVSAKVGTQFIKRFENHQWAPRMAFRIGQCHYKNEAYKTAGQAFDNFTKKFPDDDLTAQALFWSGESHRQAKDTRVAFQRYNRCRWDFPESDAAKYARGRLALPEMIQQFEREAQAVENDQ